MTIEMPSRLSGLEYVAKTWTHRTSASGERREPRWSVSGTGARPNGFVVVLAHECMRRSHVAFTADEVAKLDDAGFARLIVERLEAAMLVPCECDLRLNGHDPGDEDRS